MRERQVFLIYIQQNDQATTKDCLYLQQACKENNLRLRGEVEWSHSHRKEEVAKYQVSVTQYGLHHPSNILACINSGKQKGTAISEFDALMGLLSRKDLTRLDTYIRLKTLKDSHGSASLGYNDFYLQSDKDNRQLALPDGFLAILRIKFRFGSVR